MAVTANLSIPMSELRWRVSTPGGPGGQHANKTSSKVEVRFDVTASPSLGPRQRTRLLERLGPVVRASSSQDRSQARNRQIALDRLAERLAAALRTEVPRRPTRPTAGSKTRRLDAKRRRGTTKQRRTEQVDLDD
jgi:ribosome-associated protein